MIAKIRDRDKGPVGYPKWEPLFGARSDVGRSAYLALRTAVEFVGALVMLVVAAPVILVAALLTRLTSPGAPFYSQTRLGRNGRPYRIYKIRTMVANCEGATGARWSTPGDPRITPFGAFLRRTHVDELPQLWNVLKGDMSLIGPRPERPEFVPTLERAIPRYRERLLVRPGVTGLAQVQLPPDRDLSDVRRKLAYDLFYVERVNAWLDLRILICTALKVVGVPFGVLRKLFRMPYPGDVEEVSRDAAAWVVAVPELQAS